MIQKIIFCFILTFSIFQSVQAATVIFWTDSRTAGGGYIEVYVNDVYRGRITSYYGSAPDCGASGCVTVTITGTDNTWYAVGKNGSRWPEKGYGRVTLGSGCNRLRLRYSGGDYSGGDGGGGTPQDSNTAQGNNTGEDNSAGGALAVAAGVVIVAAAAAGVTFLSTDVYAYRSEGANNGGWSFGLRNRMDPHIDLEYGASYMSGKEKGLLPAFKNDFPYDMRRLNDKGVWTLDFNTIYNILPKQRRPMFNPYIGIAAGLFLPLKEFDPKVRVGMGPMLGVSYGDRLKVHVRYKYVKNWSRNLVLANQLEIGLSLTYKYGWRFSDQ